MNMEKNERQQQLLQAIVEEYVKTAKPVSSKSLVEAYGFDYSAATIRNDMAELEEGGYIAQPHTSAGRVPTEQGYQYYIQHFLHHRPLDRRTQQALAHAANQEERNDPNRIKHVAKAVAELSGETVVVSLGNDEYYFTGMAHMLRKPEFLEHAEMLAQVGDMLDRIDEVMTQVTQQMQPNMQVLIGHNNPIANTCSLIVTQYRHPHRSGTVGIFGPMRMDYNTNIALLEYIESVMDNEHERS